MNNTQQPTQKCEQEVDEHLACLLKKQSQPLRVVTPEYSYLGTSRCMGSRLWFLHNKGTENRALDYLAKYATIYEVKVQAFVIMGNHYHILARYPKGNKKEFFRDLNARISEGIRRFTSIDDGGVFARRYSAEIVPRPEDVVDRICYCALQTVSAGLFAHESHSPLFNSINYLLTNTPIVREVVDQGAYKAARRNNKNVPIERYTETYTLQFELPEGVTTEQLKEELDRQRADILEERRKKGLRPLGLIKFKKIKQGSYPKKTKKSSRHSYRPRVLTRCGETYRALNAWLKAIRTEYKHSCVQWLRGNKDVEFPPGTYHPPNFPLKRCAAFC